MSPFVLVWTALLGVQFLTGCAVEPDCTIGVTRCEGGVLEQCTAHPGAVFGPIDDPSYVHGSGPNWENVADCGADRCITPGSGAAFCALDAAPSAACTGQDHACDGQTLVTCQAGYAIERKLCSTCDARDGTCAQGTGAGCADATCGGPLQCDAAAYPTCELPCTCPDGAECDACGASWAAAPDGGASLHWTCQAGLCAFHY